MEEEADVRGPRFFYSIGSVGAVRPCERNVRHEVVIKRPRTCIMLIQIETDNYRSPRTQLYFVFLL